jgi:hypothetical protein
MRGCEIGNAALGLRWMEEQVESIKYLGSLISAFLIFP